MYIFGFRKFLVWLLAVFYVSSTLQSCASTNIQAEGVSAASKDADTRSEAAFLATYASVQFIRTDTISGPVAIFDAKDSAKITELNPLESETVWLKQGAYSLFVSSNLRTLDRSDAYEVELEVSGSHSYEVKVTMSKSLARKPKASRPDTLSKMIGAVGVSLILVVLSISSGGAGTIIAPPANIFSKSDDDDQEGKTLESFEVTQGNSI